MSVIVLPNAPITVSPASNTELDDNFTEIANTLNGGLDNDNFSGDAGITNANLASPNQVVTVSAKVQGNGTAWDTRFPSGGEVVCLVPVPGDTDNANWTVVDASWAMQGTGSVAATFDLDWAEYDGNGDFVSVTSLASGVTLTVTTNEGNAVHFIDGASTSIAFSATEQRFIAVRATATGGTGVLLTEASDFLVVSINLSRETTA